MSIDAHLIDDVVDAYVARGGAPIFRRMGSFMTLHFLVVEGNTAAGREEYRIGFGKAPNESYADALREIAPGAGCDVCFPADSGADLRAALAGVLTLLERIVAELLNETCNRGVVGFGGDDGAERQNQHKAGDPAWQPGGHLRLVAR